MNEWLEQRIQLTQTEHDEATDLNIKIGKGSKLCAYKECLNYIRIHGFNLSTLTLEELQSTITTAENLIRTKERETKEQRKQKALSELNEGDDVMVTGDRFRNEIWKVIKRNPKKVKCKRPNGEVWNIPYAHIILK